MPFDGSGNFNRVMNWVSDALANIKIVATRHDSEDDNFASGLSNCITKDGQTQPTANIPMNGKKIINLAAPTVATDAATKGYTDTADGLLAPKASPTFTGTVVLPTGAAGAAPLTFPLAAAAPTTPVNGNIWPDPTTGALKHRLGGATYTYGRLEAAQIWTADQTFSTNILVNGVASVFGTANAVGQIGLQGQSIEIGVARNADGVSFLDLHSAVGTDFDARLLRNSGTNGVLSLQNLGTGGLSFQSGGANGTFTYNASPILVTNLDNLALAAGFGAAAVIDDGTKSSGTYTPGVAGGNIRKIINGGAFTLAAEASATTAYTALLLITNNATAGAITFSGWQAGQPSGDALNTTNGAVFLCTIAKVGGIKLINIQAL